MKTHSIRFKASVLFTLILCGILVSYSSVIFLTVRRSLYRSLDKEMQIKGDQIASMINAYNEMSRIESRPSMLIRELFSSDVFGIRNRKIIDELWDSDVKSLGIANDYFVVLDNTGRPLLYSKNMTEKMMKNLQARMSVDAKNIYSRDIAGDKPLRAINVPFVYANHLPLVIQLVTSRAKLQKMLHELMGFIISSILVILAVTSFLGVFLTRQILRPVADVIQTANHLSHKDLSVRIPEQEVDQEMRDLIDSFNTMLDRLEASFAHINDFSSHVAHELKTPLAIMKGEIELVLSSNRDQKEYERVMGTVLEEMDRMVRTIKDLLLLAKLDFKPDIFHFEKAGVRNFLTDLHENARVLASEKNIQVALQMPEKDIEIQYDRVHFRRLLLNLIHNAVKFTAPGGKISIALSVKNKEAVFSVSDTGEGIAPQDIPKIFDKFFRAPSKENPEPGHGLGLSIVQSIAVAHHGRVHVTSQLQQGTTFTVVLPLA